MTSRTDGGVANPQSPELSQYAAVGIIDMLRIQNQEALMAHGKVVEEAEKDLEAAQEALELASTNEYLQTRALGGRLGVVACNALKNIHRNNIARTTDEAYAIYAAYSNEDTEIRLETFQTLVDLRDQITPVSSKQPKLVVETYMAIPESTTVYSVASEPYIAVNNRTPYVLMRTNKIVRFRNNYVVNIEEEDTGTELYLPNKKYDVVEDLDVTDLFTMPEDSDYYYSVERMPDLISRYVKARIVMGLPVEKEVVADQIRRYCSPALASLVDILEA